MSSILYWKTSLLQILYKQVTPHTNYRRYCCRSLKAGDSSYKQKPSVLSARAGFQSAELPETICLHETWKGMKRLNMFEKNTNEKKNTNEYQLLNVFYKSESGVHLSFTLNLLAIRLLTQTRKRFETLN